MKAAAIELSDHVPPVRTSQIERSPSDGVGATENGGIVCPSSSI